MFEIEIDNFLEVHEGIWLMQTCVLGPSAHCKTTNQENSYLPEHVCIMYSRFPLCKIDITNQKYRNTPASWLFWSIEPAVNETNFGSFTGFYRSPFSWCPSFGSPELSLNQNKHISSAENKFLFKTKRFQLRWLDML